MSVAARIAMFSSKVASAVPAERANPEVSQALRKSNGAGASLLKARRTKSTPRSISDGEGGALAIVPPDDRVPKLREQVTQTSAACDHMELASIVSQASHTPLFQTLCVQVKQRCLGVVDELLASPAGAYFAKPVDWRGLGLVDYPTVWQPTRSVTLSCRVCQCIRLFFLRVKRTS